MAFSRTVLDKVPAFDEELGPGALGFWEDSLFSFQLKRAGYRLSFSGAAIVEHHFDQSRLSRSAFLDRAAREGCSRAYVAHHWEHRTLSSPRKEAALLALQLAKQRMIQGKAAQSEGAPEWELDLVMHFHLYKQYLVERKRSRNYDAYGLTKRNPHV
jgi:glucosyl-dolichyl phosphate glucuronosyltransferase